LITDSNKIYTCQACGERMTGEQFRERDILFRSTDATKKAQGLCPRCGNCGFTVQSDKDLPPRMKVEEWKSKAEHLFGKNMRDWVFRCPHCDNEQSVASIMARLESSLDVDEASIWKQVMYNCEGRLLEGKGCDWTVFGLFRIHVLELIHEDGTITPVFDFGTRKEANSS
jgi:DNA-directed RNA polymerase subunit RPC12/RpoP